MPIPRAASGRPPDAPLSSANPPGWKQLLQAKTTAEYCRAWLELQCGWIGAVPGAAVLLGPPDQGPYVPAARRPEDWNPAEAAPAVERAVQARKGVVWKSEPPESGQSPCFFVAYPVRAGEALHGAVVLEINSHPALRIQEVMRQVQWGVAWLELRLLKQRAGPDGLRESLLAAVMDLTAILLQEESFQASATAFATELAARLGCDRASLGFMQGARVKLRALSHSALFGRQMNLIRAIEAAMEESLDQLALLQYPEPSPDYPQVLYATQQLAGRHGAGAVCTIPFVNSQGQGYGALLLERLTEEPFDRETVRFCESAVALAAPILEQKRRNDRPLLHKAGEALRLQLAKVIGPGAMLLKVSLLLLLAFGVFLAVTPGEYRVTANTRVEGAVQRAVVVPFDGYILEAPVRAGDVVHKGQVLCRLNDMDLRLERLGLVSQREQHERQMREAQAVDDRAKTRMLSERIKQAEAEIALLERQIERAHITAPLEGIVVSGDLSQSLGAPVARGEILFEVAPLDEYRLMLDVNEYDISQLQAGQPGSLILTALPHTPLSIQVERITPVSQAKNGQNYFQVEASLKENVPHLRPGMEGYSKIRIGQRKLIWIWTHDLIDWVRLWMWSWWP